MSSSLVLGQFLWHELLTSDPEAGAGFYSKVLGWNARPWEGDDAGYSMLAAANGPVGGARVVGKDPLATTAGPSWLSYVGVPDLAIALATVQGSGGRVLHPVTSIPDGGRYAVISDPQGGVIGLYEPAGDMGDSSGAPSAGPVVWHELTAEDPEAALEFYKTLFGWEVVSTMPMGPDVGTYYLFGHGTTQLGGAYTRPKHLPPTWPRWLVYLGVPSVTAAVAAVKEAGGQLLNGPQEVPGSWVAQLVDSHGVPLAVSGPKDAAPAPKRKPKAAARSKVAGNLKAAHKPKAVAKPPVAAKPKTKAKTKARPALKAKAKSSAKTKVKSKVKAAAKKKPAPKSKRKPATKVKAKKKKTKSAARAKSRKAPRRAK